jgi:hypothetical protein
MSKYCSLMRLELHKSFNHPIETGTEALHLLLRSDDVNDFSIHNIIRFRPADIIHVGLFAKTTHICILSILPMLMK